MWRVFRFVGGALVLLLAASRASAQTYQDHCDVCNIDFGYVGIHLPFCIDAGPGQRGNTHCQTLVPAKNPFAADCVFLGDPCFPTQIMPTYYSYWIRQLVFGFTLPGGISGGSTCCEPDGTDWCALWGMGPDCT